MKFYTKEWYELIRRQNYTSVLKKIPDKEVTNDHISEIQETKNRLFCHCV